MNKNVQMAFVAMVALTVSSAFATTEVSWDQSLKPAEYADGAVKVEYSDANVSKLTLDPLAAAGLKITGEDMTLATAAEVVTTSAGTTEIANPMWQTGSKELAATLSFESKDALVYTATIAKPDTTWTTCIENMDISHITNVTARFDKNAGQSTGGVPCDTVAYVSWSKDHKVLRYEFQQYSSSATIRAVVVGFQQYGADIQVRHMYYAHLVDSKAIVGDDNIGKMSIVYDEDDNLRTGTKWGGYSYSKPQSNVNSACFASNVVVAVDAPIAQAQIQLSGANALSNVALTIGSESPATVMITEKTAFPAGSSPASSIEVGPYGALVLAAANGMSVGGIDHGIPITVRKGGLLRCIYHMQFSYDSSRITLDGGTMQVGAAGMYNEPGHYIHNLTMRNGATVNGDSMRLRDNNVVWTVEGTSPSYYNTGVCVWSTGGSKECVFNLDVADVTGDDQVDFTMVGPWTRPVHLDAGYRTCGVTKKGAGTMRIDGTVTLGYRPLKLEAGTLLINGSLMQTNVMETFSGGVQCDVHQDVTLAGGTLAFAANSTNDFGVALATGTAGGLTLGAYSEVNFADSSAQSWSSDAVVVLNYDPATSKVRFGTDANGLTAAQLKRLRYQTASGPRYQFGLDADGYLTLNPPLGMVLIVK